MLRLGMPAALFFICVITTAMGQESGPSPAAKMGKKAPAGTKAQADAFEFERLLPAKEMLGRQVVRGERPIGAIVDLAIDLETEQVALVVVEPDDAKADGGEMKYLSIPAAVLDVDAGRAVVHPSITDEMVAAARRFALRSARITREWAAQEFANYRRDPYWAEFRDRRKKEFPDRKFDEKAPTLTLYSKILKTPVTDEKERKIGTIAGLAYDAGSSSVAYAAFDAAEGDAGWRAIPLGAFETENPDKSWQIRLDEASILKFPTFDGESAWPKKLERGWVEYIAHRYGRGGLQTEPQNTKATRDREK